MYEVHHTGGRFSYIPSTKRKVKIELKDFCQILFLTEPNPSIHSTYILSAN